MYVSMVWLVYVCILIPLHRTIPINFSIFVHVLIAFFNLYGSLCPSRQEQNKVLRTQLAQASGPLHCG